LRLIGGDDACSGQIVILGPQLAIGYWRAPEQTAAAFRELTVDGTSRRAYFTGDWARQSGGRLYFESRIDHQVKINGFRIELSEVAGAIRSLGWNQVVVVKVRNHLVAVIEGSGGDALLNRDELHRQLAKKLDRYALPSHFVVLETFPRNQNDKIDVRAITDLATKAIC
jgi:D-alanine--poly(phosphoribitol) ligase subunit 1